MFKISAIIMSLIMLGFNLKVIFEINLSNSTMNLKVNIKSNQSNLYLFIILIVSILARLIYFKFEKLSPLYLYPIIDEKEFLETGEQLSNHWMLLKGYFWHPPLYSYFIGFLKLIGFGIKGILVVQSFLGISGTILFFLAIKKYHQTIAFIAALIWSVYPLQLFVESKILSENLFIFLSFILFYLISSSTKPNSNKLVLFGLISGLIIITKSQFVIFVLFYLIYLWKKLEFKPKQILIYAFSALIFPLAISLHNTYYSGGKFLFASANGPINVYLGNSSDIEKTLNIRPSEWKNEFFPRLYDEAGIYFTDNTSDTTSQKVHLLTNFLRQKTLNDNLSFQVGLKNFVYKTIILFHSQETPRNYDLYEYKKWNPYLNYTIGRKPFYFPLILFFYAAIIFLIVKRKDIENSRSFLLMVILILTNLIPSLLIFNAFRYRLPAVPFLIFFAILFYKEFYKNYKFLIINVVLILLLGTNVLKGMLIQKIPLAETYDNFADGFMKQGKQVYAQKYYDKAAEYIKEEEVHESTQHDVLLRQGYLADQNGNLQEAIEYFSQAIHANSKSTEAYYNRAVAEYKLNDFAKSRNDYTKAIDIGFKDNNKKAFAYFGRGLVYIRVSKFDSALIDMNDAIKYKSDYGQAYANRGILLAQSGKIKEGISDFDSAIILNYKEAKVYNDRGIAYVNLNRMQDGLNDFTTAISINPNYAESYFFRSMILYDLGKKDEACNDMKTAADLGLPDAQSEYSRLCK